MYPGPRSSMETSPILVKHSNSLHTCTKKYSFFYNVVGRDSPSIAQKAGSIKKRIGSFNYIKSSNFCIVKDTTHRLREQTIDRDGICIAYNEATVNIYNMQSVPKNP